MNKKYKSIIFVILLLLGLAAAVVLVRQSQETRRGAFFGTKKLQLEPATGNTLNIGDNLLVHLRVVGVGSTGSKVDNIRSVVCFNSALIDIDPALPNIRQSVTINNPSNSIFDHKYLINVYDILSNSAGSSVPNVETINKCVDLTIGSAKPAADLKNEGEFAIVHLKAKAPGSGKVKILKEYTKVSGNNITDPSIQVDSVGDLAYTINAGTISPTTVPGTGLVLNFKMAFDYLMPNANCANWKVQVKVNGKDGSSKTYDNVSLTKTTETSGGYAVYDGSVRLVDFTQTNDLAVFIKGPKHLATKYGVNNQTGFYNQLNGQIGGLTNNSVTSPVFDFSRYPLLAGDVTGETIGVQDGVINGIDFSYTKEQARVRSTVASGSDLLADLNGDCIVVSQDPIILTRSLIDKQEQTY